MKKKRILIELDPYGNAYLYKSPSLCQNRTYKWVLVLVTMRRGIKVSIVTEKQARELEKAFIPANKKERQILGIRSYFRDGGVEVKNEE